MSDPYKLIIANAAERDIRRLDFSVALRINTAISTLSSNPRPPGCKKLVDREGAWRLRVGDYRVIYNIDDDGREIVIRAVRHRSAVYD
jgi:mRNA interferase RelE/StbE